MMTATTIHRLYPNEYVLWAIGSVYLLKRYHHGNIIIESEEEEVEEEYSIEVPSLWLLL